MKKLFAIVLLMTVSFANGEPIKQNMSKVKHNQNNFVKTHVKQNNKVIKTKKKVVSIPPTIKTSPNRSYDHLFKYWVNYYLPDMDYRLLKAICINESGLDAKLISSEGAKGLCQIMSSTWRGLRVKNKTLPRNGIFIPTHSIQAAAIYLRDLNEFWNMYMDDQNKLKIILASYNSGMGNINKAKKICGNPHQYEKIMKCLPKITGRNARVTNMYVSSVLNTYKQL